LVLSLTALALLVTLQFTVLRPTYLMEQVNSTQFTAMVQEDIENTFVSYGISSGVDEQFVRDFFDENRIRIDIFAEMDRLYDSDAAGANIESFKEDLNQKLHQYVESKDAIITPQIEEGLGYLTDICAEAYSDRLTVPFVGTLASVITSLQKSIPVAFVGLAIFTIVLAAVILFLRPKKYKALRYYAYALAGSGLVVGALALLLITSGKIERVGISSKALYTLITSYLLNIAYPILWTAICLIIAAVVVALIFTYRKKRSHQR
jgi:hypothetical protein